jgi:hypothetical protein
MATWQAVNIQTGAVEGPKYYEISSASEIWVATLTTALANGDTIIGPPMPPGVYLENVVIDTDDLDGGGALTFTVGYAGALAAFISTTTIGQTGGIVSGNVAGMTGLTFAATTPVLVTITHAASPPTAGKMRIRVSYTASP